LVQKWYQEGCPKCSRAHSIIRKSQKVSGPRVSILRNNRLKLIDKLFVCEAGHWHGVEADLTWHNALAFWITRAVGLKKDALSNDLVKKRFGPAFIFISGGSRVFIERWGRRG
jgi:hypothetical protein